MASANTSPTSLPACTCISLLTPPPRPLPSLEAGAAEAEAEAGAGALAPDSVTAWFRSSRVAASVMAFSSASQYSTKLPNSRLVRPAKVQEQPMRTDTSARCKLCTRERGGNVYPCESVSVVDTRIRAESIKRTHSHMLTRVHHTHTTCALIPTAALTLAAPRICEVAVTLRSSSSRPFPGGKITATLAPKTVRFALSSAAPIFDSAACCSWENCLTNSCMTGFVAAGPFSSKLICTGLCSRRISKSSAKTCRSVGICTPEAPGSAS